jgi:hypothetical protein
MHVLIPEVTLPTGGAHSLGQLTYLRMLLERMKRENEIEVGDNSPVDPYEIALAKAWGLPSEPGRTPWAAFETKTFGTPCAWFSPVHLQAGMNDVLLSDTQDLKLTPEQSQALLQSCAALLEQDGITLHYVRPDAWLAQGELLDGLTCSSLRRARGHPVFVQQLLQANNPAQHKRMMRLTNELQMLLYTHPINDVREREKLDDINALWIHGAGRLERSIESECLVKVAHDLVPAESNNADKVKAWQDLDAVWLGPLFDRLQQGHTIALTLSGQRRARTWRTSGTTHKYSWWRRARHMLMPISLDAALEGL